MNRQLVWKSLSLVLIAFIANVQELLATHIRAGEIVAVRISSTTLTYRFSLIAYTDTGSQVPFGGGHLNFGDGTEGPLEDFSDYQEERDLGDEIRYNLWEFTHTFQGPGTYVVRYDERNRNDGVLNMSNSVDTPFYIETQITIDPFLGLNNTPIFLVPPIDRGCVGVAFFHNPGAYDPDGDSLSYHITTPKQSFERDVNNYLAPNDPSFYETYTEGNEDQSGTPDFKIDAATGNLTWDAPGTQGEYNVAFIVKEWRRLDGEWFLQGYVTRDMQIIIEDCNNGRPELIEPPELCVEAGTEIEEFITGTDPDGHDVKVEVFGGPFEFRNNAPVLTPSPAFRPSPQSIQFNWQTDCDMVRQRPYDFQLKVTDDPTSIPDDDIPGPKLTDFKSWNITIVAPAPTGLTATQEPISDSTIAATRRIRLNWDAYSCGNADSIEIWRRVGEFPFQAADCTVGMPETAGYQLVALVGNNRIDNGQSVPNTTFVDDNDGKGLAPGAQFCYRIVARFPDPAGGESYASDEACREIGQSAPIPLNVDVTKTGTADGEIYVRWAPPTDLDPVDYPPPYSYMVVRADGYEEDTNMDTLAITDQLEFTDTGINTMDLVYNYRIRVMNLAGTITIDTSLPASSVRMEPTPEVGIIALNWSAQTPWSIVSADYPIHEVYRAVDDGFSEKDDLSYELIGEVTAGVDGLTYIDDGSTLGTPGELDDETDYCYYVFTQGSYGNDNLAGYDPLINKSQIACARPNDNIAPCAPVLSDVFDCAQSLSFVSCSWEDFFHDLEWEDDMSEGCDDDIRSYDIYFSLDGSEDGFEVVGNSTLNSFTHRRPGDSFKGCYKIKAIDRSGNQSEFSNTVCFDNCPNIVMPNAFTPNGDGINDVFTPFNSVVLGQPVPEWDDNGKCPRFVETVKFTVFDRTGGDIFTYNSEDFVGEEPKNINWKGVNNAGVELPSGVYFYSLEVVFDRLDSRDALESFEGWVQIIR